MKRRTEQPRRSEQQLWTTAYHEAGHVVAAVELRVGIGRRGASIIPSEEFFGSAHILKGFSGRPDAGKTGAMQLGAERRAIVLLAGGAAQRQFRPSSVRHYHSSSDLHRAANLMDHFVGSNRELKAYLDLLQIRAENLVSTPHCWTRIKAVAEALVERKKLTPQEIRTVCFDVIRKIVAR